MAFALSNKNLRSPRIPFFLLLFVCFAGAILGDSTAEALILSHFGAAVIPNMYLVNAFFLFFTSLVLMSMIDKVDRGVFFTWFLLIHALVLFCVWIAITVGMTFLYIPLFSYAYITKIILFLMFWTLANDVIDSRNAGKDFPFIAAGGTVGAVSISFSIPWLLKIISAQYLLLFWSGLIVGVVLLFLPVKHAFGRSFMQRSDKNKPKTSRLNLLLSGFSLLYREPLLANMSILYFLIFFVLLNQQYVFYQIIKIRFVHADSLAGFLGYFNGISMAVTFLLQITLAGIIIKKIGSTRAMFLLPLIFCIVFGSLCLFGNLVTDKTMGMGVVKQVFWIVVMGVGLRIAFFDSFFSPNFQIFFSSLPQDVRGKGKLAIEGIIKPAAMIIASVWLLSVTKHISFTVNMIILFAISMAMVVQTFRIRMKYTESLTRYLADFKSRIFPQNIDLENIKSSKDSIALLKEMVYNESFELKAYSIEILTSMNTRESIAILTDYLSHADSKIKATIISSLSRIKRDDLKPLFIRMLSDSDTRVIANAIDAIIQFNDSLLTDSVRPFLFHDNNRIKSNAVVALWPFADEKSRRTLQAILKEMIDSENSRVCASALYALKEIEFSEQVAALIDYSYQRKECILARDPMLWRNFLRLIRKRPLQKYIDIFINLSIRLTLKKRNEIVSAVRDACKNGYQSTLLLQDLKKRRTQALNLTLEVLCFLDMHISEKDEHDLIAIALHEYESVKQEAERYTMLMNHAVNDSIELLAVAIKEECVNLHIWNLIYIAAILDSTKRIKKVIRRLVHENQHVRARAIEVLDNAGNMKVNRLVIPLLENEEMVQKHLPVRMLSPAENNLMHTQIKKYEQHENEWIRACAAYAVVSFAV